LAIGAFFLVLAGLFGVLGALLVYFGANGTMDWVFFGQGFEIANLGLLSLFVAGIIVVVTLERVMKRIDEFNNRQGIDSLRR
jgi:zinc transporter ZupT